MYGRKGDLEFPEDPATWAGTGPGHFPFPVTGFFNMKLVFSQFIAAAVKLYNLASYTTWD